MGMIHFDQFFPVLGWKSRTTTPAITWPGAADAIHVVVAITARTNVVRDWALETVVESFQI